MRLPWQPQLLAHLAGLVLASGGALPSLPSPANISYIFDDGGCTLSVRWDPIQLPCGDSYDLMYYTALLDGKTESDQVWRPEPHRKMAVLLGKNMSFLLRAECFIDNRKGELFQIPLQQKGMAETGATNVSCICHNAEWMACSWRRGRQSPRDTSYHLSFWHEHMEEPQLCANHSVDGDTFRCVFRINCSGVRTLSLSLWSNSQDIQPVCVKMKEGTKQPDYPVKLDPPSNLRIEKGQNVFFLLWDAPRSWKGICYNVDVDGERSESYEDGTNVTITLDPEKYHTLRVRAVLAILGKGCTEVRGLWSEWSKPVHLGEQEQLETLSIILFITIPLCATILTIILLVYLKRIQLLIFPIIPDPEKVLKRMFEDQRDEYLPVDYPSEFIIPDKIKTDFRMS
ncbi:interleukin-13 receptor subunit alpha-1 [Erythrolamprus reginae]|uniref:interleukin-13 receptor subunit alpha-1 n=1 Tax=Erythrolamprus reginae TaxID=121349 RepID=UPI00396CC721